MVKYDKLNSILPSDSRPLAVCHKPGCISVQQIAKLFSVLIIGCEVTLWVSENTANKIHCTLRVLKIHHFSVYSLSYFCSVSSLPPPFPLCLISFKPHSVPLSQEYLHACFTPEGLSMCNHCKRAKYKYILDVCSALDLCNCRKSLGADVKRILNWNKTLVLTSSET